MQPQQQFEQEFGSTVNAHQNFMATLWGPSANVAIILAQYSYRRYPFLMHAAFGLVAFFFTLSSSIPMLVKTGIIPNTSNISPFVSSNALKNHYLVGITCLVVITVETALGILTKCVNIAGKRSSIVILSKRIHQIFGFIILILCKSNYYIISPGSYLLMVQDAAFVVIIVVWKLYFPKMESAISPKVNNLAEIPSITTLSKLPTDTNYCILANLVYDLAPVKLFHPAGYQVIESVKNRQIDRYVYGMYSSEALPEISKHSHSFKFYSLLGKPVAKISIPAPFSDFANGEVVARIETLQLISNEGCVYELRLTNQNGEFVFQGYTELQQLGRYHSVTYNKTSRLYTSVNFLFDSNKMFMEKVLNLSKYFKPVKIKPKVELELTKYPLKKNMMQDGERSHCLSILFKLYKGGKFTEPLVNQCSHTFPILTLSEPKGEGMRLAQARPGKIIMVAGGTGIYPFSDLIDLLFKELLMKQRPELRTQICQLSPVLSSKSFDQFSFHLMGAFRQLADIHPITLEQLFFLSKNHPKFSFTAKVSPNDHSLLLGAKVTLHTGSFDKLLRGQFQEKSKISKIFVCGPPRMNEQLSRLLRQSLEDELYLIM